MEDWDEHYMNLAIDAAKEAYALDEVPIGAVIIDHKGTVLATQGNCTIGGNDPTGHAEVLALRKAGKKVNNYRLTGCTLYTTIEPCVMCAGALVNARIKRLVYGADDERFGAVKTLFNICDNGSLNHQIEIQSGVLESECRRLMQEFFKEKRTSSKVY
ncbi:MAG: nucleoside deaminase [Pyrinomonadaceae bacterium]|nr:nucleoside deaminase [Pyrinomonadaceae bacterium]